MKINFASNSQYKTHNKCKFGIRIDNKIKSDLYQLGENIIDEYGPKSKQFKTFERNVMQLSLLCPKCKLSSGAVYQNGEYIDTVKISLNSCEYCFGSNDYFVTQGNLKNNDNFTKIIKKLKELHKSLPLKDKKISPLEKLLEYTTFR